MDPASSPALRRTVRVVLVLASEILDDPSLPRTALQNDKRWFRASIKEL